MSAKARSLRERMSIDPDAPSPVSERRSPTRPSRSRPVSDDDPAERRGDRHDERPDDASSAAQAAEPAPSAAVETGVEPATDTVAVPEDSTDRPSTPSRAALSAPSAPSASRARSAPRRSGARGARRSSKDRVEWETAVDDPAISADGNGYRSFYVSDEVFARFRAAIYWTARRPDVDDVPDNMSVGIEEYMDSVATDLERRFNDRGIFPPTPDQVRAHRRRQNRS